MSRQSLAESRDGSAVRDMTTWSDRQLDAFRQLGDPVADAVIDEVFREHAAGAVNVLFRGITADADPLPPGLPGCVRRFLEETDALPAQIDSAVVRSGEEMFCRHGVACVTALFCSALPQTYCAHRGAAVLVETGRMVSDLDRRVLETAQFIIDVMAPGGLEPGGRGVRSAQKVRLIHAAVRHLCLARGDWPSRELGVPVNQEDLAGTLLAFSLVIPTGLEALGVELAATERDAYYHTWQCIGHLLGIDPVLIPDSLAEAEELYGLVRRRQMGPSEAGRTLAAALLDAMRGWVPGEMFDGAPVAYTRHLIGDELAEMLDIPPVDWTAFVLRVGGLIDDWLDPDDDSSGLLSAVAKPFSRALMTGATTAIRGSKGVPLSIPESLRGSWRLERGPESGA